MTAHQKFEVGNLSLVMFEFLLAFAGIHCLVMSLQISTFLQFIVTSLVLSLIYSVVYFL